MNRRAVFEDDFNYSSDDQGENILRRVSRRSSEAKIKSLLSDHDEDTLEQLEKKLAEQAEQLRLARALYKKRKGVEISNEDALQRRLRDLTEDSNNNEAQVRGNLRSEILETLPSKQKDESIIELELQNRIAQLETSKRLEKLAQTKARLDNLRKLRQELEISVVTSQKPVAAEAKVNESQAALVTNIEPNRRQEPEQASASTNKTIADLMAQRRKEYEQKMLDSEELKRQLQTAREEIARQKSILARIRNDGVNISVDDSDNSEDDSVSPVAQATDMQQRESFSVPKLNLDSLSRKPSTLLNVKAPSKPILKPQTSDGSEVKTHMLTQSNLEAFNTLNNGGTVAISADTAPTVPVGTRVNRFRAVAKAVGALSSLSKQSRMNRESNMSDDLVTEISGDDESDIVNPLTHKLTERTQFLQKERQEYDRRQRLLRIQIHESTIQALQNDVYDELINELVEEIIDTTYDEFIAVDSMIRRSLNDLVLSSIKNAINSSMTFPVLQGALDEILKDKQRYRYRAYTFDEIEEREQREHEKQLETQEGAERDDEDAEDKKSTTSAADSSDAEELEEEEEMAKEYTIIPLPPRQAKTQTEQKAVNALKETAQGLKSSNKSINPVARNSIELEPAASYDDLELKYWENIHFVKKHNIEVKSRVSCIHLSPDTNHLAIATYTGVVMAYDMRHAIPLLVRKTEPELPKVTHLCWSFDGYRLLAHSMTNTKLLSMRSSKPQDKDIDWAEEKVIKTLLTHEKKPNQSQAASAVAVRRKASTLIASAKTPAPTRQRSSSANTTLSKKRDQLVPEEQSEQHQQLANVLTTIEFMYKPIAPSVLFTVLPHHLMRPEELKATLETGNTDDIPRSVRSYFHPSLTAFGSQPSILIGCSQGTICKFNILTESQHVFFGRPLYSEDVVDPKDQEAPFTLVVPGHDKKKNNSGEPNVLFSREVFQGHNHKIKFIGFVENNPEHVVSVDEKGYVLVWTYDRKFLSGFRWLNPDKKYRISLKEEKHRRVSEWTQIYPPVSARTQMEKQGSLKAAVNKGSPAGIKRMKALATKAKLVNSAINDMMPENPSSSAHSDILEEDDADTSGRYQVNAKATRKIVIPHVDATTKEEIVANLFRHMDIWKQTKVGTEEITILMPQNRELGGFAEFHKVRRRKYTYNNTNSSSGSPRLTEGAEYQEMQLVEGHDIATFKSYTLQASICDVKPTLAFKELVFLLFFEATETDEKYFSSLVFDLHGMRFLPAHRINFTSPEISKRGIAHAPLIRVSPVLHNTGSDYLYVLFPGADEIQVYSLATNQLVKNAVFNGSIPMAPSIAAGLVPGSPEYQQATKAAAKKEKRVQKFNSFTLDCNHHRLLALSYRQNVNVYSIVDSNDLDSKIKLWKCLQEMTHMERERQSNMDDANNNNNNNSPGRLPRTAANPPPALRRSPSMISLYSASSYRFPHNSQSRIGGGRIAAGSSAVPPNNAGGSGTSGTTSKSATSPTNSGGSGGSGDPYNHARHRLDSAPVELMVIDKEFERYLIVRSLVLEIVDYSIAFIGIDSDRR